MEQKFQTSFIPRKSAVEVVLPSHTSVGAFTLVSIGIFVITLLATGGLFLYKQSLIRQGESLRAELAMYQAKLDEPIVGELLTVNNRLNVASERLTNHVSASSLLEYLSGSTLQDVRWSSFYFQVDDSGSRKLTMNGQARSFAAVALQQDKMTADTAQFINPVFSSINLDGNGNPQFVLTTDVSPNLTSYEVQKQGENIIEAPVEDATTTEQ